MDESPSTEAECASTFFVNEVTPVEDAAIFDASLVNTEISDFNDWTSDWQSNGPYISDCNSSQLSLAQQMPSFCPGSPVGSNSSWTDEDDTGPLFFEIEQRLRSFILAQEQTEMIIPPLDNQQRRVIHAMAHLMHLGHKSFKNEGKLCRMQIFKKTGVKVVSDELPTNSGAQGSNQAHSDYWKLPMLESTQSLPAKLPGTSSLSRKFEYQLRIPKRERGFPCRFSDCLKMFDRSCDRRKHEKRHEPKDSHPYRCTLEKCNKTFMYPKDLRRHERVHERNFAQSTGAYESSTDEVFSDASASSFSESPSLAASASSANSTSSFFLSRSVSDEDLTPMPKYCQPWFDGEYEKDFGRSIGTNWLLDPAGLDIVLQDDLHEGIKSL